MDCNKESLIFMRMVCCVVSEGLASNLINIFFMHAMREY